MKRQLLIFLILLSAGSVMAFPGGKTLANLTVTGTGIKWYAADVSVTVLPSSTPLVTGTTYYATQTINGVESTIRLAITVTINTAITYYQDADGDGYGNPTVTESNCTGPSAGYVTNSTDCNDANAVVHPVTVVAIAGGASTVCVGATTPAFTDATASGVWSIVPGSGTANIAESGIVTGLTAGTVTVTYTNANWCGSEATTSVTIDDKTETPVVSNIAIGATSVSGTCNEADGTSIEIFVGEDSVGTTTLLSHSWTKSDLTAFTADDLVKAQAKASGKCLSSVSIPVSGGDQ